MTDSLLAYAAYGLGWLILIGAYLPIGMRLLKRHDHWLCHASCLWYLGMAFAAVYLAIFHNTKVLPVSWCAQFLFFFGPLGCAGFAIAFYRRKRRALSDSAEQTTPTAALPQDQPPGAGGFDAESWARAIANTVSILALAVLGLGVLMALALQTRG